MNYSSPQKPYPEGKDTEPPPPPPHVPTALAAPRAEPRLPPQHLGPPSGPASGRGSWHTWPWPWLVQSVSVQPPRTGPWPGHLTAALWDTLPGGLGADLPPARSRGQGPLCGWVAWGPRPTAERSKLTTPGNTLATSSPTAAACRGAPGGGWGGPAPARERWPSPRASPQTPHQVLCPPRGHCRVAEPSEAWFRAALQGGPERPAVRDCHGRHYCPQQRTWGRARPSTGGHGGLRSAWRRVGAPRLGGRVLGSLLPRAGAGVLPLDLC